MDKKYYEIELPLGINIKKCVEILLRYKERGELVYGVFNGHKLYSDTVTLDDAYKQIVGSTYQEYEKKLETLSEEYKNLKQEHLKLIPEKAMLYMQRGREILDPDKIIEWDKIIPIRLHDIYEGLELDCSLKIIKILNNGTFEEAKKEFESQGHSGHSFHLTCAIIEKFSSKGKEFITYMGE